MSTSTSSSTSVVHVRPVSGVVARITQYVDARQSRRELEAVLSGDHGSTVRNEVLARLDR